MLTLWNHQKLAVEKARVRKHLALFHEVGTGKTASMITILREEFNTNKRLMRTLILCPLSVCQQWRREILRFSKIPDTHVHALTGPGKKRAEFLSSYGNGLVITNYEALLNKEFYRELLHWAPEILVCDESHRLKDPSSSRSKKLYPLAKSCKRRFLLTGTPILNSMMDIFGQFKILDDNVFGPNQFTFRVKYFYDKNAGMPSHCHFPDWQPRPESAKKIAAMISNLSCQAKKSECLDLPELLRVVIPVELSPEQMRAYLSMKKEFVAEMGEKITVAEFAMTKTLRMQQILSGFIFGEKEKDATWVGDNPRLKALEECLESLNGQKTIIWTVFRPTYSKIAKVCEGLKLSYAFLTGDESAKEKQESLDSFCKGDTQVLIANPAAGGVGVNIVEAKYAIYFAKGYSLEHFVQSEARNYRAGSEQHDKVTHFHIEATGTLDEVIGQALRNKQAVADCVLDWARNITLDKGKIVS